MAVAYRFATATSYASRSNASVSLSGVQDGDYVVACLQIETRTLGAVTLPSGWTTIAQTADTGSSSTFATHLVGRMWSTGDATTVTFTHAAQYCGAFVIAYSGVDSSTPLDVTTATTTGSTSGAGQSATATGVTTATNNAMLVGIRCSWDGGAISPPSGWTERVDTVLWAGEKTQTSAGATGSISIDPGNGAGAGKGWITHVLALRPSGGGGPNAGTLLAAVPKLTGALYGDVLPGETSRTTGVTTNGTAWTRVEVTISGDPAVCYFPTALSGGTGTNLVVMAHGSGDVQSTLIDGSYYSNTATRDHIIDQGWIAFAPYAGGDNFANSTSQAVYSNALTWVNNLWPITGLVHFGFSMGALTGITFAMLGTYSAWPVRGYVCVDLPWDVAWFWANGGSYASGLLTAAYGSYSATYDPATYSTSAYSGMRALCSWSPDDTVAVSSAGGPAMASYAGGVANITLVQTSGEHGSTSHFIPSTINAWLDEAFSNPASLNGSTPKLTCSIVGSTVNPGTLAGVLPLPGSSITGQATNPGVLAAATPRITGAIVGSQSNGSTLAATLPRVTGSLADQPSNSGTLAGVLPALTSSNSGSSANPASMSAALPKLTGSIADQASNSASIVGVLPVATGALAGASTNPAALSPSLPVVTGASIATQTNPASTVGTLPKLTGSLSDQTVNAATIVGMLPRLTGGLTAQSLNPAAMASALPVVTGVLSGGSVNLAVVAATLPTLAGTMVGQSIIPALLVASLPRLYGYVMDGDVTYGGPVRDARLTLTTQSGRLALTTQPGRMEIS